MDKNTLAKTLNSSTFKLNKSALYEAMKNNPNDKYLVIKNILRCLDGYSYNEAKAILEEVLNNIGDINFDYDLFCKNIKSDSDLKEE